MNEESSFTVAIITVAVLLGLVLAFHGNQPATFNSPGQIQAGLETFQSQDDFREYLSQAAEDSGYTGRTQFQSVDEMAVETNMRSAPAAEGDAGGGTAVDRYSGTNVQVQGIDEPDILKSDGETIYFSQQSYWADNTSIIDALPADEPEIRSWVDESGQLLLHNDTLVLLKHGELQAYDVSNPDEPAKTWDAAFNGSMQTARLYNGKIYLVTRQGLDHGSPCPIRPMVAQRDVIVPCTSIYHPPAGSDVDVTYNAMSIDAATGDVNEAASLVGSSTDTVVYMSSNAIYLTYTAEESRADLMLDFLLSDATDLLDQQVIDRLEQLRSYELSDRAKYLEVTTIVENWRNRLSQDRRLQVGNELENRLGNYSQRHMRDYQSTGIAKIGLDSLDVEAKGDVPGRPLNQFSMDEHQDDLRIATTVGGILGNAPSENDVYVLDEDLERRGSVQGMGVNERIYSVRFIDDRGYVVTFRRIDPFHVLDLSDPDNPELEGELKLPGFSSYLHPLGNDTVLGVGEEDGQVKAVMFDVSDPANPTVQDSYRLDERWSAIRQTHHAFLHDPKHGVFFLPGSQGGYIFSYDSGLELERAVNMDDAERAMYINDYMYIFSDTEMVVLDEQDWSRVAKLSLGDEPDYRRPIVEPFVER